MPKNSRWSDERLSPRRRNEWRAMLAAQHGVVHVRQLREFSVSRATIQANLDGDRWRRILRGVYATFTGPLTYAAKVSAALLYGGPGAMLSHSTAAHAWRNVHGEVDDDTDERAIEITVPYGRSAISQPPLVKVHRSRAFRHIGTGTQPERTTRVDTLVDVAVAAATERAAVARFVNLGGRWPITVARLWRNLEARPPYRYRRALNRAMQLVADGVMSALEREYHEHVELAHGLPPGSRQQSFVVDGRRLYEDVTYDHLGAPLTVRADSRTWHATPGVAFRDRRRDNAGELAGRSRLVYGWHEVHGDPCGVAGEVAAVLRRHGVLVIHRECPKCARTPHRVAS